MRITAHSFTDGRKDTAETRAYRLGRTPATLSNRTSLLRGRANSAGGRPAIWPFAAQSITPSTAARDAHIVNITLVPPSGGITEVEQELEARYGLEEAVLVAVSDETDSDRVATELGPAAAECLLRCVNDGDTIGLAWGRTVLAMVDALPVHPLSEATVVQLNGGLGPVGELEHSAELARRAAQKLNARLRLMPAPGIVSSVAAAIALRADYQISEVLTLAAHADVAVVGLGVRQRSCCYETAESSRRPI